MATTSWSYDDKAMKEDLMNVLNNLTPTETQLMTGLGKTKASSIRHEILIDTLTAVKANAQIEGASISYNTITHPARIVNHCQIFQQGFKVSDTERAIDTAGFDDRYNYEKIKALKMLKNDAEYSLMRGSMVSGSGSAARMLRGIKAALSLISAQSGVSVSEAIFNDYLQLVWDSSSTEVNAVYGDMYMKRKISGFTAGATKNVETTDRRLVNAVDIYQADAAHMVKLFAHRHVTISGTDTNHDFVGINEDLFKVAFLRQPELKEAQDGGDYSGGSYVMELTLEDRHYNGGFSAFAHL